MPPTTPRYTWTYDEYARLPDDGNRYEVIDGEVLVTPSPSPTHLHILQKLFMALHPYADRERLGLVFVGVDYSSSKVSSCVPTCSSYRTRVMASPAVVSRRHRDSSSRSSRRPAARSTV